MCKNHHNQQGSVLVMALGTIAILAFLAATILYSLGARYQSSYHSASWHEALNAAESGIDKTLATLNYTIPQLDDTPAVTLARKNAWASWTPSDATTFPKTYQAVVLTHQGDGNQKMYVSTTIDNTVKDGSGRTWYRIRCIGTTELPGTSRVGIDASVRNTSGKANHLSSLHRLSFKTDRTGGKLHVPQVSRTVEVMVRNVAASPFFAVAAVLKDFSMTGGAFTDSFDPRDPAKSTKGQYDPAKRQSHGNIGSNSDGAISDLKGSFVYGDAASNGGTLKGTSNVKGKVYNNYSGTFPPVGTPTFATVMASPTTVNNPAVPMVLTAGTKAAPANYKLATIDLSSDAKSLILVSPVPGEESYINIWVTGDLKTTGTGSIITQSAGVHATIYVQGDVKVSGSGVDNKNGQASMLTVYGVTPTDGSTRSWDISGTANFIAAVYAPAYDFKLTGSGDLMGAFVFNRATINGGAGFHFDESLAGAPVGSNDTYVVSSWVEDIR